MVKTENYVDNYTDGAAAGAWSVFIGDTGTRHLCYKEDLCRILRDHGARRILDAACGTGADSVMLVEEGFEVTSVDASDQMLKYAYKTRWERRKEPGFDNWEIRQANWLTLVDDLADILGEGFDALICLGNSYAHILDLNCDQSDQRLALKNFKACLKPGGLLIIDHRNYDVYKVGLVPVSINIYYHMKREYDVITTIVDRKGRTQYIQYDYTLVPLESSNERNGKGSDKSASVNFTFRLFPHLLKAFSQMLEETFDSKGEHKVYGDYKELTEDYAPGYFIHTIKKVL